MKPKAPIVKRNLARWKRKFARNFHSKKRVEWIRSLPCAFCGGNRMIRNAHMNARGMGGCGGNYTRILPLCIDCDERYALGRKSFLEVIGVTWAQVEAKLAQVNAAWESMGSPSSTDSEVAVRGRRPPEPLDAAAVSGATP